MADHRERVLYHCIRSLLLHRILPTYELVFNAIVGLKRAQNAAFVGPSRRWFRIDAAPSGLLSTLLFGVIRADFLEVIALYNRKKDSNYSSM